MLQIAAHLRALHLFYHQAHNLAKGDTFWADHKLLQHFYKELSNNYDEVAERIVMHMGNQALNLHDILTRASQTLDVHPSINSLPTTTGSFAVASQLEKVLCGMIKEQLDTVPHTHGTEDMLARMADNSEARQYKIDQRIK